MKFALFTVPRSTTLPCMSNSTYLSPTRAPATCRLRFITLTLNCCAIAYAGKASLPLLELDDFAEELLLFAEELDFALLLEDFAEELLDTLEEDFAELLLDFGGSTEELDTLEEDSSLELDATELLEGGNFSKVATRSTSSLASK